MEEPPPDPLPIRAPVPMAYWWWFQALKKSASDLEVDRFRNVEVLGNAHVPVVDAGLAQPVARRVAVNAEGGLAEAAKLMRCMTSVRLE